MGAIDKKRLVQIIGCVDAEDVKGFSGGCDNIAIALASYFSGHLDCPDKEDDEFDDETGWSLWVMEKTNTALAKIADAVLDATKP